jgi:hypothetical protein
MAEQRKPRKVITVLIDEPVADAIEGRAALTRSPVRQSRRSQPRGSQKKHQRKA